MSFLDRFTPEQRNLFESAATRLDVPHGDYLMRRGEPGGDIFYVAAGEFDIIDTRTTPEVILKVVLPGEVVGEMSFIDDSPRSADVRARSDGAVLRWRRADLRNLLNRTPALAAAFFESMARTAAGRTREVTTSAVKGTLGPQEARGGTNVAHAREEARTLADRTKEKFLESETRLRKDPHDPHAQARVGDILDELVAEMSRLHADYPDTEAGAEAAKVLGRELHPYLVRSSLAERCYRRSEAVGGAAEVLAHVLFDAAGGDGQLGELIDRWWLDRPTFQGLRALRKVLPKQTVLDLPTFRNRRVLVINAGTGSIPATIAAQVAHPPTVVTVVDANPEALAFLDENMTTWPDSVELHTIQESLAALALRRARIDIPPQDAVVIHGLIEYLPEQIAISLIDVARGLLSPQGELIVGTLDESPDDVALDWLLRWPTIRRSNETMSRLLQAASLDVIATPEAAFPARVLLGRPTQQSRRAGTPVIAGRR
jgi:extracellular factor (EF) 3-hydroxypalmitic acid methyl ester biosynthesis protein